MTRMHIELAVVEMNVVLIDILDTESIHHDRAGRYGFRKIFLAMAVSTDRAAVGDPVARIKVVDRAAIHRAGRSLLLRQRP